jgi:hypothetical protein
MNKSLIKPKNQQINLKIRNLTQNKVVKVKKNINNSQNYDVIYYYKKSFVFFDFFQQNILNKHK